jgi:cytochrome c2
VHGGALAQTPEEGRGVFEAKCASCHTIGGGPLVGPDLEGAADRLGGPDALADFVAAPDEVRPGTAMPNLGLTELEIAALVAFLTGSAAPPPPPPTEPPPAAAGTGDPAAGKDLFEGDQRFAAGGAPCLSCHSIAGIGALGGGQIGPDLTDALARLGGEAGLSGVLTQIAFPTMRPIYADQALTAQEVADLVAFIAQAPEAERPANSAGKLFGLAVAAVAVLVLAAFVIWRGRLRSVRRSLVSRSTGR